MGRPLTPATADWDAAMMEYVKSHYQMFLPEITSWI
jgi:hypothetical protein